MWNVCGKSKQDQPANVNPTYEKLVTFGAELEHKDSKISTTLPDWSHQSNATIGGWASIYIESLLRAIDV